MTGLDEKERVQDGRRNTAPHQENRITTFDYLDQQKSRI